MARSNLQRTIISDKSKREREREIVCCQSHRSVPFDELVIDPVIDDDKWRNEDIAE